MRLVTFEAGGRQQLGAIQGQMIISLDAAVQGMAHDMISLIENWNEAKSKVEEALATATTSYKFDEVRLAAPVARPGKIACMGLNYLDHIEESGIDRPEHQMWFCKASSAVNGPFDPIPMPKVSDALDYEVELVVVIGRRGKHIPLENSPDHIFGYCVGNDVSVRDWQLQTSQFFIGKSFDGHAPFGPWITTRDDVPDPHSLGIRCLVNGQTRQKSNTSQLLFNVWEMIHHLSQAMTLDPGDLIFTGTPGGIGWTMDPRQVLKTGDVVRCEIDQLGEIEGVVSPER